MTRTFLWQAMQTKTSPQARTFLTGPQLVGLMRQYRVTIATLAQRLRTTETRVRHLRGFGLGRFEARDWMQAITGHDPGALAYPWRGHETLRSTQLPEDVCGGTRLFLRYQAGMERPYVVETRWEQHGRYDNLEAAEMAFEALACGPGAQQQRAGT
jgi:hypothetical protein